MLFIATVVWVTARRSGEKTGILGGQPQRTHLLHTQDPDREVHIVPSPNPHMPSLQLQTHFVGSHLSDVWASGSQPVQWPCSQQGSEREGTKGQRREGRSPSQMYDQPRGPGPPTDQPWMRDCAFSAGGRQRGNWPGPSFKEHGRHAPSVSPESSALGTSKAKGSKISDLEQVQGFLAV